MVGSGGKVVELWGFPLFIAEGNCRDCQGLSRDHRGALQWGICRDSFSCGGMARTSLHRGIVVDPWGKQVEHVQGALQHIKRY